jgi:MarR family transcriptional regulator, lower aerobic nicotinate degradation pathway regulator
MDSQPLTIVDALAQTSFVIQGAVEAQAAEHDVSLIQTRLLGILRDREPTINELAALLGLDKSSISGLVLRAEKRGLVTRTRSQADGRSVLVTLTAHGRGVVDDVAGRFAADVLELLSPLTVAERAALADLLTRVLAAHADGRGVSITTGTRPRA